MQRVGKTGKWLAAWLVVLGILICGGAAAEGRPEADLFEIYNVENESAVWIGTGIPIADGMLLASCAELPENLSGLIFSDGSGTREITAACTDSTGMIILLYYQAEDEETIRNAYYLADPTIPLDPADAWVRDGDAMQSRVNREIYSASPVNWLGMDCMILHLSGNAKPGAAVLTGDGRLAGMITAEYAEGENRVVAISADQISRFVTEATARLNEETEGNPPEGFTVTAERNMVTFDWSAMTLPEKTEGEEWYLIVADIGNYYLTYLPISGELTRCTMLLTPGRTYKSGITARSGIPGEVPERFALTVLEKAKPLEEHGFHSLICTIATQQGEEMIPAAEVTEELLRSGKASFYSVSAYEVDQTYEGLDLLITLTDPRGVNYRYVTGWVYDPSYMTNDSWSVLLKDTGLLEMLNEQGYPAGTYEIAFYVEGELGDRFTFELK